MYCEVAKGCERGVRLETETGHVKLGGCGGCFLLDCSKDTVECGSSGYAGVGGGSSGGEVAGDVDVEASGESTEGEARVSRGRLGALATCSDGRRVEGPRSDEVEGEGMAACR